MLDRTQALVERRLGSNAHGAAIVSRSFFNRGHGQPR